MDEVSNLNYAACPFATLPPLRVRSTVISVYVSVCMFVCLSARMFDVSHTDCVLVSVCRLSFLSFILPYSAILVRISVVIANGPESNMTRIFRRVQDYIGPLSKTTL